jgi:hypothetical protein
VVLILWLPLEAGSTTLLGVTEGVDGGGTGGGGGVAITLEVTAVVPVGPASTIPLPLKDFLTWKKSPPSSMKWPVGSTSVIGLLSA